MSMAIIMVREQCITTQTYWCSAPYQYARFIFGVCSETHHPYQLGMCACLCMHHAYRYVHACMYHAHWYASRYTGTYVCTIYIIIMHTSMYTPFLCHGYQYTLPVPYTYTLTVMLIVPTSHPYTHILHPYSFKQVICTYVLCTLVQQWYTYL